MNPKLCVSCCCISLPFPFSKKGLCSSGDVLTGWTCWGPVLQGSILPPCRCGFEQGRREELWKEELCCAWQQRTAHRDVQGCFLVWAEERRQVVGLRAHRLR